MDIVLIKQCQGCEVVIKGVEVGKVEEGGFLNRIG